MAHTNFEMARLKITLYCNLVDYKNKFSRVSLGKTLNDNMISYFEEIRP